MKNIEKYYNTKDALAAYNALDLKKVPFNVWLECEFEEPRVPTLIKAAQEVVKTWYAKIPEGSLVRVGQSIVRLSTAIEREMRKPVRNCDKYKTAEEACQALKEFCGKYKCRDCRFGDRVDVTDCTILWLYEEAAKEETK